MNKDGSPATMAGEDQLPDSSMPQDRALRMAESMRSFRRKATSSVRSGVTGLLGFVRDLLIVILNILALVLIQIQKGLRKVANAGRKAAGAASAARSRSAAKPAAPTSGATVGKPTVTRKTRTIVSSTTTTGTPASGTKAAAASTSSSSGGSSSSASRTTPRQMHRAAQANIDARRRGEPTPSTRINRARERDERLVREAAQQAAEAAAAATAAKLASKQPPSPPASKPVTEEDLIARSDRHIRKAVSDRVQAARLRNSGGRKPPNGDNPREVYVADNHDGSSTGNRVASWLAALLVLILLVGAFYWVAGPVWNGITHLGGGSVECGTFAGHPVTAPDQQACADVMAALNNPAADSDNDGVINSADNCPNVSGDPSNNGCPLPSASSKPDDQTPPSPGASQDGNPPAPGGPAVIGGIGSGDINTAYQAGAVGSDPFCKALGFDASGNGGVIGGPSLKWWGTQNPDGTSVANSCILREADDRDPIGWSVTLPSGTVAHIWLVDPTRPNIHVAVTAVGPATIQDPFLASRMTVYFATAPISASHAGMWTYGIWPGTTTSTPCGWVKVGINVPVCNTSVPTDEGTGSATNAGGSTSNSGKTSCTLASVKSATGVSNGTWKQTGNYWVRTGSASTFTASAHYVIQYPGANNTTLTKKSGTVTAAAVTIYCV